MSHIYKVMSNCAATSADYNNRLHGMVSCKSAINAGSKLLRSSSIWIAIGLSFSYQAFAVVPYITSSQDIVAVSDNCRSTIGNTSASVDLIAMGCDSKRTQASTTVDTDSSNEVTALDKSSSMTLNNMKSRSKAVTASGGQLTTLRNDLDDAINELGYKINEVEDNANAGISAAMAMSSIPQSFLPGRSLVGGGITTYNGESAVAIGLSTVSNSGQWVIKVNGTADSQGNAGGAIGAGVHF